MKYGILGAGRQGVAAAYDLIKFGNAEKLCLWDSSEQAALDGARRVNELLTSTVAFGELLDVSNGKALQKALKTVDGVLCAVPYKYNLEVTEAAIATRTCMVDLGGHTATVRKQLELSPSASQAGISIVPDCGMGPGMNITLALLAMEQMESPEHVQIWDGGLPEKPEDPWNYALFFNINGLTNEYDGSAVFLENGILSEVPGLSQIETVGFPAPFGQLEAAVTTGGLSTMPWTYEGKLSTLKNKTLRYPGHWHWMRAYRELGMFSESPVEVDGHKIVPREFYHCLLDRCINRGRVPDVCLMRVQCDGMERGKAVSIRVEAMENYDPATGFLAMEKWTGWHASIMLIKAVSESLQKGVISVEKALSGTEFLVEAKKRHFDITIKPV
ncbi:MAG: hypothetical protein GXO91_08080 [FCB group bacterium]|nr:hypothetical protein [FCB group bacterium]